MYDILIVLNNFFHDLAAAMWFCSTIILFYLQHFSENHPKKETVAKTLYNKFRKIALGSLALVCVGGIIRAFHYRQYEWLPALGRHQITLLIVKHILLTGIVVAGLVILWRAQRSFSSQDRY